MEHNTNLFHINTSIIELMNLRDHKLQIIHNFSLSTEPAKQIQSLQDEVDYLAQCIEEITNKKLEILNKTKKNNPHLWRWLMDNRDNDPPVLKIIAIKNKANPYLKGAQDNV